MNYIVLDIKTAANDRLDLFLETVEVVPPGNYKTDEAIAKHRKETLKKIADKAALSWWTGKVLCIGMKHFPSDEKIFFGGDNEEKVLTQFFKLISNPTDYHLPLPSVNLAGKSPYDFDIPFIIGRALVHDLGIPDVLRLVRSPIRDVDDIFGRSPRCQQKSNLNNYAFGMDCPMKLEDSAWIPKAYISKPDDFWDKLRDHCMADVDVTYEMIKRYEKVFE